MRELRVTWTARGPAPGAVYTYDDFHGGRWSGYVTNVHCATICGYVACGNSVRAVVLEDGAKHLQDFDLSELEVMP